VRTGRQVQWEWEGCKEPQHHQVSMLGFEPGYLTPDCSLCNVGACVGRAQKA
jgi:hypothetical protein